MLTAWLRLAHTPKIGAERQRKLLAAFGLPEQIFDASHHSIAAIIGTEAADHLLAPYNERLIEDALAWAAEPGNHIITLADEIYPQTLLNADNPPILLFVKGNPALLNRPSLAIVGARSATPQGEENARAFAHHLAQSGLTIISGLALGIDAAAHHGALAGNRTTSTIAVIGTGADRIYPAGNAELAHQIAAHGAIVSEFPLGTAALRHNFPRRNRIISGLSLGVLVVEAATGSGSLITARLAAETNREVFAIPGSIHSPLSRGCHKLIREGAKLVETSQDILEELRGCYSPLQEIIQPSATDSVPAEYDEETSRILATIGHDPLDVDTLASRSGLTIDKLYAILLTMELDGLITRLPGNRFQRFQATHAHSR